MESETYSKPSQTCKMECFVKTVNAWKTLTTFTKRSILVGADFKYTAYKSTESFYYVRTL